MTKSTYKKKKSTEFEFNLGAYSFGGLESVPSRWGAWHQQAGMAPEQ